LTLRKIIKTVAARCHIIKLKCTKFDFLWGSAQTHCGSLQHSQCPLAGFKGATSKGNEGRGRKGPIGRGGGGRNRGEGKW